MSSSAIFLPSSVAGLKGWFDASDATTVTMSSGRVSAWRDKSGIGNDVAQATGANQPFLVSGVRAGLSAMLFDGVAYYMARATLIASLAQPNTIIAAWYHNNTASGYLNDGVASGRHAPLINLSGSGAGKLSMFAGSSPADASITSDSRWIVTTALFNTAASTLWIDGVARLSGVNVGTNNFDGLTLGARFSAANFLDGFIGEWLVYNASLSTDDRTAVEMYLSEKWQIPRK